MEVLMADSPVLTRQAEAVLAAAYRNRVTLTASEAEEIAAAVLEAHDGLLEQCVPLPRREWQDEELRARLRRHLFARLAAQAADTGLTLYGQMAERVTYHRTPTTYAAFVAGDFIGPEVPEDGNWDTARLTVTMPVRKQAA
jgi:hypothetical protein